MKQERAGRSGIATWALPRGRWAGVASGDTPLKAEMAMPSGSQLNHAQEGVPSGQACLCSWALSG